MDRRGGASVDDVHHAGGARPAGAEWLIGGGELGELVRRTDWAATTVGPSDRWPASLRAVVNLVVATRVPMALLWGRDLVLIHNDAFGELAGGHPAAALGRPAPEICPEAWRLCAPHVAAVMERGETVHLEDALSPIDRRGHRDDAYVTVCYSPVRVEDGSVGGTLVTIQDRTAQLAERGRREEEARAQAAQVGAIPDAVGDEQGRLVRGFVTIRDITEQARANAERDRAEVALRDANERLREADRRKDEFLGMLSHELRNPLAPIRNSLYILDHSEPGGQQARRAKEIASRQIAYMTRLVDDLLDVTRIARGKIELRRAPLDLAALARRTTEDHRALMHGRSLALAVEVPDEPLVVCGDETRLAQVLGNLLHNAAKFTPAGGRVALAVGVEDGRAVVHVRDTGAGIAADVLATIFEPFTQAEQTLARSEGGLGLGLALVRGLVALHGGEVAAVSPGPGHGTDFVVTLPLAAPRGDAAAEDRVPTAEAPDRSRRVLVIDDNRDAADSLAQLVAMLGHTTDVAYDAIDGLAKATEHVPDVVLCDIGLPGMDGYEFARQFRARSRRRDIRLVAVSGYAQPDDVARAAEAGFDAHVAKPPDPERLEQVLGPSA